MSGTDGAHEKKPASLAQFGALLGDPVRSAILRHLSDGSRRPAGELASLAGASPQAASAHLAQLVESGLLRVQREGRHRFFCISSGEAAELVEQLANWVDEPRRSPRFNRHLREARLCYDHLAGRLAVQVFACMSARGMFTVGSGALELSESGKCWCSAHSLDLARPAKSRRPTVCLCLDWTERRHHMGGLFGAAFTRWMIDRKFIRRSGAPRSLVVSREGEAFLRSEFSIDPRVAS